MLRKGCIQTIYVTYVHTYISFHTNIMKFDFLIMVVHFFFQVLEMSDILEHNGACSERSVVILLVFLSAQLIVRKSKVVVGAC